MNKPTIEVAVISATNECPVYGTPASSGVDVKANINLPMSIAPHSSLLIPTGLKVAIPEGYEIQVRSRSGLALKHNITVLNSPGTIDADYRGEIGIILFNHSETPYLIQPQEKIAQLVLCPVEKIEWVMVKELPITVRGDGGYGHTGQ